MTAKEEWRFWLGTLLLGIWCAVCVASLAGIGRMPGWVSLSSYACLLGPMIFMLYALYRLEKK